MCTSNAWNLIIFATSWEGESEMKWQHTHMFMITCACNRRLCHPPLNEPLNTAIISKMCVKYIESGKIAAGTKW